MLELTVGVLGILVVLAVVLSVNRRRRINRRRQADLLFSAQQSRIRREWAQTQGTSHDRRL